MTAIGGPVFPPAAASDDGLTRLAAPSHDTDETIFQPASTADEGLTRLAAPSHDTDETIFQPAPAADEGLTRLAAPSPDTDETIFQPAPAADEGLTRLAAPTTDDAETVFRPAFTGDGGRRERTPPPAGRSAAGGTTGPLDVGQAFSSRYHIIRVLGIGGMGAVYHAWDAELGMAVALKVIRPEATTDPASSREMERRFKQELVLARQVTHKNVVRIHDLGEIDGIKYITMPYLEGSDLATTMKQDGKMPVPAALRIVRDVAAGLVAAHEAGIVHRDLKPANIMVLKDHAVIMDFGIARSSGRVAQEAAVAGAGAGLSSLASVSTAAAATVVGTVLGTVQYMAPEQARGQAVDQRADVYALGLIFRDMLLGRRQTAGADDNAFEELKQRMEHAPPKARTIDPAIPEPVDQLIARCLEPDSGARFQTSAELVAELDRLDEHGKLRPIKRVVGMPLAAAVATLLLTLSGFIWWNTRPPVTHDPVSVLIADFVNTTSDATFDRTLEPALQLALEGAGFISAYDRAGIRRTLGVLPPERLDEMTARELALKQGVGVVLSGTVSPEARGGYRLSVRAIRTVTGEEIVSAEEQAANKDGVLAAATGLATEVRLALGDDESESAQRFAMETLSATNLDVVRAYAGAMEALSRSRFDEALQGFSKAVAVDPKFGLAYAGMAITSRNLDRQQDAEKYAKEAVSHVDGMTERERYRTRGLFYMVTSDYQACVKEYGDLIARYAADAAARNNMALCSTYLRDWPRALDEMKQVVKILPGRALYRVNLALYQSYAGQFEAGEQEARAMEEPGLFGLLALAFAQAGQGQLAEARATYQALGKIDAQGASYMTSGLGDLAIYEGRFSDAESLLTEGAAVDLANEDSFKAAAKFAAVAHARLQRGRMRPAVQAAESALEANQSVKIQFLAARIFLEAGEADRARELAAGLAKQFQAEPQAYAKIIEAEAVLKGGDPRKAVTLLTEANTLFDTWVGHFDLGRAYLEAGAFTQADSEFDRCIGRRGEVLALFLDEEPTYGFLPPVYYYQGRVREGLNSAGATESYKTYLAIRGNSTEDPLLPDVRKRANLSLKP